MVDRSSRPHRSPSRTHRRVEKKIKHLRTKKQLGPAQIAGRLGMHPSTVHRVIVRLGLPKLVLIDQATSEVIRRVKPRRYEHKAPMDLVHVDIKKLGNIPDGGGWRIHGREIDKQNTQAHRDPSPPRKVHGRANLGHSYIHSAVDDYSRLAYCEVLPDERAETAAAFWLRAVVWFADQGIVVDRVLTDKPDPPSSQADRLSRKELLVVLAAQAETIEVQAARIAELMATVESLTQQVVSLTAQVAELTAKLGQNSGNSSLPPSSDRFVKPQRDRRGPTSRRPGKQPGAPGSALEFVADPDEVIDHEPVSCGGCGGDLSDAIDGGWVARQVRDVPLVTVTVTEHRMHKRLCSCGAVTSANAPGGVVAPVCYGANLRAIAVYLVVFQHVPVERTTQLVADLTGATPSTGWVSAQVARTADTLVEVETLIRTLITLAAVIGCDETTVNVAGRKHWLHVARTDQLTAYFLHPNRGRVAVEEFNILPAYAGTVVHDALAVYDIYPATHGLCASHLIRELTAVAELHPDAIWPVQARTALADLIAAARTAREQGLPAIPAQHSAQALHLFRQAVLVGLSEHRRAPGRKQSKARNLLERLRDREEEILRFTVDLRVPATNNGSERDLRPVKTQIKISGCHHADTGAKAWLRVRGYISTIRKHGDDVLTALRDAITGNPWTPPIPAT